MNEFSDYKLGVPVEPPLEPCMTAKREVHAYVVSFSPEALKALARAVLYGDYEGAARVDVDET